ncbi:hypothetical protein GCM10022226_21130 [Sphaerisporangium flaviroseum]|uniref:DUF305 domain-containing protein n=2 Tax=Sphaerisporangium flaviroseum TaxID=509199 RepID=A0ABP7HV98_9ACTN
MRAAAAGALLAVSLITGCAAATPAPGARPASGGTTATVPSAAAVTAPGGFGPTDIAWVELMIPMNEQTLRLLAMVPERSTDPGVERLASQIRTTHRAELVRLRQLLLRAGVPLTNPHKGHNMPGMVTADELRAIGETRGSAFDRLFTENMGEHLRQSALVSRGEQSSGTSEDTKALAATVERTRTAQLADLARLGAHPATGGRALGGVAFPRRDGDAVRAPTQAGIPRSTFAGLSGNHGRTGVGGTLLQFPEILP